MTNLVITLNAVLPVFLVMATGYLCRQIGLITEKTAMACNKLVFQVFLPVSLAQSLMNVDSSASIEGRLLFYCATGVFAVFLAGMLIVPRFVRENSKRGVLIQALFRSNYAIVGIPIGQALFPQGDGGIVAMMTIASVPVFNALAVVTLEYFRGGKPSWGKILKGMATNPLILGCLTGYLLMRLNVRLPQIALSTVSKLASVASPLALFVLGATLDLKKVSGNLRLLAGGLLGRLLLAPGLLLAIGAALGFRGPGLAALMIAFASPCAVSSYTMAVQMGGDGDLAGQLVMFSTVLSAVTLSGFIFLFKSLGLF